MSSFDHSKFNCLVCGNEDILEKAGIYFAETLIYLCSKCDLLWKKAENLGK